MTARTKYRLGVFASAGLLFALIVVLTPLLVIGLGK